MNDARIYQRSRRAFFVSGLLLIWATSLALFFAHRSVRVTSDWQTIGLILTEWVVLPGLSPAWAMLVEVRRPRAHRRTGIILALSPLLTVLGGLALEVAGWQVVSSQPFPEMSGLPLLVGPGFWLLLGPLVALGVLAGANLTERLRRPARGHVEAKG
jgi:hypothetical protein